MRNNFIYIIALAIFVILAIPVWAEENSTTELGQKLPITIMDKNGVSYKFQDEYELRHGLASFTYFLVSMDDPKTVTIVYEGETFGDAEKCPDENMAEYVILDKATTSRRYVIKDVDVDGWKDIVFYVTELDCRTHVLTHIEKTFFATNNGFKPK